MNINRKVNEKLENYGPLVRNLQKKEHVSLRTAPSFFVTPKHIHTYRDTETHTHNNMPLSTAKDLRIVIKYFDG